MTLRIVQTVLQLRSILVIIALALGGCSNAPVAKEKVSIFRGADYTAYCADSVRVYLAKCFDGSRLQQGQDSCNSYSGVPYEDVELKMLLSSGELTGEMFCRSYQATVGSDPPRLYGPHATRSYSDSLLPELNWHAGTIVVLQWLNRCTIDGGVRTSLCVSMDPNEVGGHCFIFSFYLENGKVRNFTYQGMII